MLIRVPGAGGTAPPVTARRGEPEPRQGCREMRLAGEGGHGPGGGGPCAQQRLWHENRGSLGCGGCRTQARCLPGRHSWPAGAELPGNGNGGTRSPERWWRPGGAVLWGSTACWDPGRPGLRWRSGTWTTQGTCPTPPRQVLAAGIEANIPVTYGIGSQRGDGALAVNS